MKKSHVVQIVSFLFILLFLYTGINKLIDFTVFKYQIAASPVLAPVAWWIAWLIPAAEFIVSGLLLVAGWRLMGMYAALILMASFTVYIILIMSFSKELPCSCGGVIALLSWKQHLIFNCVFILLAITGIVMERNRTVV